jgi:hypothetical protein
MEFLLIRNEVLHRGGLLFYIIPSLLYNLMKVIPETCRLTPTQQFYLELYHGQKKLISNEMMMRSALY